MKLALEEAGKGVGRTSPNPVVGAVLVKNKKIISRGYHKMAGFPHAEIEALTKAGDDAKGATLYVTLEPCSHHGKTPPCTDAIIAAGISRVVFAIDDPNPQASGGFNILKNAGIEVKKNVLKEEASKINAPFFTSVRVGRPYIFLKMAMTLDGHIAERNGNSKYITGEKARILVHEWRDQYDAIMVGGNTISKDDPSLTCRLVDGGRNPIRIILDTNLNHLTVNSVISNDLAARTIVFTGKKVSDIKMKALLSKGIEVVSSELDNNGLINIHNVVTNIHNMGINSLFVEGGSRLATNLMENRLVDELALFYAPVLLLDKKAPFAFESPQLFSLNDITKIDEISYSRVGDDFLVRGKVKYKGSKV